MSIKFRSQHTYRSEPYTTTGKIDFRKKAKECGTLNELQSALRESGLERITLIIGIDYTASNLYKGDKSFNGKSLHYLSGKTEYGNRDLTTLNPYQATISVLGRTVEGLDEDNLIPVYGFGATKKENEVFPLANDDKPCKGFRQVLDVYNSVTPRIQLGASTNFAPLIKKAISLVEQKKTFHILIIISDGEVTNERDTVNAIVDASEYPLSIVMIGVGDGPWNQMEDFEYKLPERKFDNFHFVNYHALVSEYDGNETKFAIEALKEIPDVFQDLVKKQMIVRETTSSPKVKPDRSKFLTNISKTCADVYAELKAAGLDSFHLIVGLDYSASNDYAGWLSFKGLPLHTITEETKRKTYDLINNPTLDTNFNDLNVWNPYQAVIGIIGKTLALYSTEDKILAYGFGDERTSDEDVFSFYPSGGAAAGFPELLKEYNTKTPSLRFSGPSSLAPIIKKGIDIVKTTEGYHILVIIADGQITRANPSDYDETVKAIVEASKYSLSIIMIGVGDGPWELMETFEKSLSGRRFSNWHFVNFHQTCQKGNTHQEREAAFASDVFKTIPSQYKEIQRLGLLSNNN